MGMPNREKVISGLTHCSEDGCKGCPYEDDCKTIDRFSLLARDALELLQEQEPRLLGIDELKEGDVVWLESDDHKDVNVVEVAVIEKYDGYLSVDFSESFAHFESTIPPGDDYEDYGVSWRCWTSRPTEEQREAIPWRSI